VSDAAGAHQCSRSVVYLTHVQWRNSQIVTIREAAV